MPNTLRIAPVTVSDPIRVGSVVQQLVPANNPIAVFSAAYAGGSTGIQISATIGVAVNAVCIQLLRGTSLDRTRATLIQSWSGPFTALQHLSYSDTDQAALTAPLNYYWLTIVYQQSPIYTANSYGPQAVYVNAGVQSQEQIPAFSASATSLGGGVVRVGISFERPSAPDFGSVQIFGTNYLGIAAQQLLAQSATDPFSFTLEQQAPAITLQADSVNIQGAPFPGGPTLNLNINGTNTVPCVVYNAIAVSISNGNQITFPAGPEANITAYKLYRNVTGGGFGSATLVESIAPGQQASYTILDLIGSPSGFEYYLVATNAVGDSGPSPTITPGASFASGSQGTGAAATALTVANGTNKSVVLGFITNQGTNYYQTPLVTFSGSSLSSNATGYCTVDGSGHVNAIILTQGGLYASADVVSISIHY